MKSRQILKAFDNYCVTYYYERKCNPFVITHNGHVVEKYADYKSCIIYIYNLTGNFEKLESK